jgi:hypothetical protein
MLYLHWLFPQDFFDNDLVNSMSQTVREVALLVFRIVPIDGLSVVRIEHGRSLSSG